jgi:hypothetical protein
MSESGQTRTSSLGAARPLPPSADIGPRGQSVGLLWAWGAFFSEGLAMTATTPRPHCIVYVSGITRTPPRQYKSVSPDPRQ